MNDQRHPRRVFFRSGALAAAGFFVGGGKAAAGEGGVSPQPDPVGFPRVLSSDRVVRVPADYDTLQDAVDEESKWFVPQGPRIILLIQSGHQPIQNLALMGGDYSHFWIRAEDDVVHLNPNMVFKTTPTGGVTCLLDCHHGRAPVLDCLFDMGRIGRRGFRLFNSQGIVWQGAGIRNAEEDGFDCGHGSSIWIHGGIATGCGRHNLHVSHGSLCSARTGGTSVFSGATGDFPHNAAGTNVGFYHGAIGSIAGAVCRSAAQDGVNVIHGSSLDATAIDASNAGRDGVRVGDAGTLHVRTTKLANAGRHGINARHCATIEARDCDVSGAGGNGVNADDASRIDASGVIARNCGGIGIRAGSGSTINARNADASGSKGGEGDFRVEQGAFINASGATGDFPQSLNRLTSAGVVFKD